VSDAVLVGEGAVFDRKVNKVTVYGRYIERRLGGNVPSLGELQKEMCGRLKELRGFGNCGEPTLSTREKALKKLGGL
jgi:hypothetical protein